MATDITGELARLEKESAGLEPAADTTRQWTEMAIRYAAEFVNTLDDFPTYSGIDDSRLLETLPFEDTGRPMDELLTILEKAVDRPGINPASGGHLGYIPGGGIVPSALGDYLAAITNRYAGIYFACPGAVRMENLLIRWMADLFGYPDTSHGNLASGGSIANLIAITTARDAMRVTADKISRSVIYTHKQTHHCVDKAIRIAGLGECQLRTIELDTGYRMRPEALEQQIHVDREAGFLPFMVVASLGSTDTGAVDPISDIADICERHKIWLHVDAAYGGFFILVDELKHHFEGVNRADSLVIDPHKGMFLPYGLGAVIVRDANALHKSHSYIANYMQDAAEPFDQYSPAELSPELTKHFRGLRMWLPMQLFGLAPFRAALKEKYLLALYFRNRIAEEGFETGPEPDLSVVIYRFRPIGVDTEVFNRYLVQLMHRDGRIFISSTTIDGQVWLRLAVLCFRTHRKHIDLLITMLCENRDRASKDLTGDDI